MGVFVFVFYIVYILRGRTCFKCSFCVSGSIVDWVRTFELWFGGF